MLGRLVNWFRRPPAGRWAIKGSYDAAGSSTEMSNYWANADSYDADSANSKAVREKLVPRSRYEVANNGYADGIARTYATDLVGTGPTLRMLTNSQGFNQMVEAAWQEWSQIVGLRRRLWTMAHAKHVDGEAVAVLQTNPGINFPVQLDLRLIETEQLQTPQLPFDFAAERDGYIDGIKFDRFGNIEWYDVLPYHPGAETAAGLTARPERIRPEFVLHWFTLRRPGQHRGVPESASTLNTGAAARRWRSAVLAAAETAADFSVLLRTAYPPDEVDAVDPMSTLDVQKRMMMALPMGWDALQMKAEQPTTTHAEFSRSLIGEQARPRSMPYNKAACDSSDYNFASGRLDHQTYYAALDVDRSDADDIVLRPLFAQWFREAVVAFGWLGGDPRSLGGARQLFGFDWPRHSIADQKAEAQANDIRLRNGSLSLSRLYADQGIDYDDEVAKMAEDFGISEEQMRSTLLLTYYPAAAQLLQQESEPAEPGVRVVDEDEEKESEAA